MAKLSFPTSPSVNDIYTQDGISYQWDGSKWTANNDTALNLDAILANGSSSTRTMTTGAITSPTAAKAWVNFNGNSTITIRDSFNVSSITDEGQGKYTVNFTNAMSNANYAILATIEESGVSVYCSIDNEVTQTASSAKVGAFLSGSGVGSGYDPDQVNVVVFGS